jgi:hypothetical protein
MGPLRAAKAWLARIDNDGCRGRGSGNAGEDNISLPAIAVLVCNCGVKFPKAEFRHLNRRLRCLPRILRRNRDKARFEDVDEDDRNDLQVCDEMIRILLREVCKCQTADKELAVTVATQTRQAFFDLLSRVTTGSLLGWMITESLVLFFPPNVWLFVHARRSLDQLERAFAPMTPAKAERRKTEGGSPAAPPFSAGKSASVRVELAHDHCPVRDRSARRRMDPTGERWAVRQAFRRDFCQWDCILLLLDELGFGVREMDSALGISHATASSWLEDCKTKAKKLAQAKPGAPTPSPKGGQTNG